MPPLRSLSRSWSALLLLFFVSGCASLRDGKGGRHTMWVMRDADNTVYLVGSVHVLPRRAHPLPRALDAAFDASDRVIFEIDLSRYSEDEIAVTMEREARYPRGDSLKNHLSRPALALLRTVLPLMDLDPDAAMQYRAWFLADVIMGRYLHEEGIRAEHGVDNYFYEKARRSRKSMGGLELLREQTNIHADITDAEAEAYLVGTLVNLPAIQRTILQIAKAWRRGDVAALDGLLNAQAAQDPKMNRAMFGVRNRRWLPQIEKMIAGDRNTMVIVGAGHLVGQGGLVQELRRRGYAVEQQ